MLYLVNMNVDIPSTVPAEEAAEIIAREKAYAQGLQHSGEWRGLWRVVGQYANWSLFDVESNERLHELLAGLPLYAYMTINVIPLAAHPSSISNN